MCARGAILPGAEGGVANLIRGTTQTEFGTGIEIGVSDPVPRGTGAIAEVVEVSVANRLSSPAASIGIVESRVADVSAGTGLGKGNTGNQQEEDK